MADVLTPEQRHKNMSRIRGKDTGPELRLRRALWRAGLRYRLNSKLPGRPDLVFTRARLAVFVDGCFWHGCAAHLVLPKTRSEFWVNKITKNKDRDRRVNEELGQLGWQVLRIWEHEINSELAVVIQSVKAAITPH